MESTPVAETLQTFQTLVNIHQIQHQALILLCTEQEQRFLALLQAKDQYVIQSLVQPMSSQADTPADAAAKLHVPLLKMDMQDNL